MNLKTLLTFLSRLPFFQALLLIFVALAVFDLLVALLLPDYRHCLADPPGAVWYFLLAPLVLLFLLGLSQWHLAVGKATLLMSILMVTPTPFIVFLKEFNMC